MAVGRPANPKSKYFQRILKPAEKKILVHAGRGDMSAGFKNRKNNKLYKCGKSHPSKGQA